MPTNYEYMIKADDDVMVAVKELIDFVKSPSLPCQFLLGSKKNGNQVLRHPAKQWAKWSVLDFSPVCQTFRYNFWASALYA